MNCGIEKIRTSTNNNKKCRCVFRDSSLLPYDLNDVGFSLLARDYKGPICIVICDDNNTEEITEKNN